MQRCRPVDDGGRGLVSLGLVVVSADQHQGRHSCYSRLRHPRPRTLLPVRLHRYSLWPVRLFFDMHAGVSFVTVDTSWTLSLSLSLSLSRSRCHASQRPRCSAKLRILDDSRLCLLLCYTSGFQIWDVEDEREARELTSRREGSIRQLTVMCSPEQPDTSASPFFNKRPVIAAVYACCLSLSLSLSLCAPCAAGCHSLPDGRVCSRSCDSVRPRIETTFPVT